MYNQEKVYQDLKLVAKCDVLALVGVAGRVHARLAAPVGHVGDDHQHQDNRGGKERKEEQPVHGRRHVRPRDLLRDVTRPLLLLVRAWWLVVVERRGTFLVLLPVVLVHGVDVRFDLEPPF